MNPFVYPRFALPLSYKFLTEPKRIFRMDCEKLKRHQDKALQKIVRYAYDVPLYHEKYKAAGIHPSDIKGMKDLERLPFISKKDITDYYPDGLLPKSYNIAKERAFKASTSGSSGKPVTVYSDFFTAANNLMFIIRQAKIYGFDWRHAKITNIGTFMEQRIDYEINETVAKYTGFIKSTDDNIRINAYDPIKTIIEKLNEVQPDVILGYPTSLQHFAYFKKKGSLDRCNPSLIQTGGYSIDKYTKQFIEEAFNCPVVNLYQSVETGGDVAFECLKGTWHINADYFKVEAINEEGTVIEDGKRGHAVVTRLFGRGTPIIRYTGMDDWIAVGECQECDCGLSTPIITHGVEGRISSRVVLPDGRVYPAASFSIVSLILNELQTRKVVQFQIIQQKVDAFEILLVIDEEERNKGIAVETIIQKIKTTYEELVGPNVSIVVHEVDKIPTSPNKPSPLVISKVSLDDGFKLLESS